MDKQLIDSKLVRRLVTTQFPKWKDLSVRPVIPSGWDNRVFHLGDDMLVRMPSAAEYAAQIEKEQKWLPRLAPFLPLSIPTPLAIGEPAENYPWKWSIYSWLKGDTASSSNIADYCDFARSLAKFFIALQRIDSTDGPLPGPHSFHRGGLLATYDEEMHKAIDILKNKIDVSIITKLWKTALSTNWHNTPVWVHGDVSLTNLLVQKGRLSSVIDFGMLTVGDPACDLTIAWTLFKSKARDIFKEMLPFDIETWNRGRAWTLWKALIIEAGLTKTNTIESAQSWRIIDEVLMDYRNKE